MRRLAFPLLCMLALAACDKPAPAVSEQPPRPVRVQTVALTAAAESLTYSGTVQPRRQADLAFRVGGKIVTRSVDVGARVRAGDALAQLDPADLQLAMEASQNAVLAAEADAANARADLGRYTSLGRASPAYIGSEFDKRTAAAQMADARLAQARRQYALAQSQRAYGTLTADADGVVTALPVEVGQVVTAGQTVATVAHTDETDVVVDVPETRLGVVRAAGDVAITLWSAPNAALHGRVREIGARADPASRTFAVRVTVQDGGRLALGSTASVRFAVAAGPPVAILPAAALTDHDGSPAVWVFDGANRRAALRPVTVALYQGDNVAIAGGLREGEQVITAGASQVDAAMTLVAWAGAAR